MWDKIRSILSVALPAIASALGGALAGNAVAALCNALGLPPDATPEQIEKGILHANPEQMIKLQQLNLQFAQLQIQEFQSARNTKRDYILGVITVWICLNISGILFFSQYVNDNIEEKVLSALIGMLATILTIYIGNKMVK